MRSLSPVAVHRDDGPACFVSHLAGRPARPSALLLTSVGLAAPVVVAALDLRAAALVAAVTWAVLVAGAAADNPHTGRLDWLAVVVLRSGEYAVIALAGITGNVSRPLIFALLCAVIYHHYDTAYRVRQAMAVPGWVELLGLGWSGRLLAAALALAIGHASAVYAAGTAYLWMLFLAESIAMWVRPQRDAAPVAEPEPAG